MIREKVLSVEGWKVITETGSKLAIGNRPFTVGEYVWTDNGTVFGHEPEASKRVFVPVEKLEGFILRNYGTGYYEFRSVLDGYPVLHKVPISPNANSNERFVYGGDIFAVMLFQSNGEVRVKIHGDALRGTYGSDTLDFTFTPDSPERTLAVDAYVDDNQKLAWKIVTSDIDEQVVKFRYFSSSTLLRTVTIDVPDNSNDFAVETSSNAITRISELGYIKTLQSTEDWGGAYGWSYTYSYHKYTQAADTPVLSRYLTVDIEKEEVKEDYIYRGYVNGAFTVTSSGVVTWTGDGTGLGMSASDQTEQPLKYSVNRSKTVKHSAEGVKVINEQCDINCYDNIRIVEIGPYVIEEEYSALHPLYTFHITFQDYHHEIDYDTDNNDETVLLSSGYRLTKVEPETSSPVVTLSKGGFVVDVSQEASYCININPLPVVETTGNTVAFYNYGLNQIGPDGNKKWIQGAYAYNLRFPVIKMAKRNFEKRINHLQQ